MKYSCLTSKAAADGEVAESTAKGAGATLLCSRELAHRPVTQVPVWIWGLVTDAMAVHPIVALPVTIPPLAKLVWASSDASRPFRLLFSFVSLHMHSVASDSL